MPTFFHQKKEQPFMYPTIVAHRSKPSFSRWIIGGLLFIGLIFGIYRFFT